MTIYKEDSDFVIAARAHKDQKFFLLKHGGFSLVEMIVSITIVVLILLATYGLIGQSMKVTQENKYKMSAMLIANQKIEQLRNLPYNSLGTVSGIPNGPVPDNELIEDSRGNFNINTVIVYVDDPFDGTDGGSPDDTLPYDYKVARIRVSWLGFLGYRQVTAFSNIAPRGIETNPGGGTLVITVFDANGQPVNLADVNVKNSLVSPAINVDYQTASSGILTIPGAPESIEGYEITVSKSGYSTSSTTARTISNPNPTLVNATVLNDQKTEISFAIDLLSTLRITTIKQNLPENWIVNTDTSGENQTNSRLTIDNDGNTYVVWQDYRNGSAGKIYAQKYDASKVAQWPNTTSPEDRVIGAANNQILPDILIDNSSASLYIAWNDNSNGNQDSYLVKLAAANGNDLWGGAKKIETAANSADQTKPRMALSGNDLIAVWQDYRSGNNDIYALKYRNDHSIAWPEFRVNSDVGTTAQTDPTVATDSGGNAFFAWTDDRDGNRDIYWAKFDSGGTRQWVNDLLANSSSSANQYTPNIALDSSGKIYLTWVDERNVNQDVYSQSFDATGTPLWSGDLRTNSDTGSSTQNGPTIAINGSDIIFIAWTDERNGNPDIYAQKLDTDGTKLWAADLRVNINADDSSQSIPDLTINPTSGKPVATWQDDRDNNYDIFATEFDIYGASTTIANLPLILTSNKRIGENPIIFKYTGTATTDSNGEVIINNLEWDSYLIATGTAATYSIVLSDPSLPVNLPPDSIIDVILNVDN